MHGMGTGVKWLASGTTSLTAAATAVDLEADAYTEAHGMDAYVQLCCLYSLMVAVASLLLAATGLGALAKRIPKPVVAGFKWGAALVILAAQSPTCLFFKVGKRRAVAHVPPRRTPAALLVGLVGRATLAREAPHDMTTATMPPHQSTQGKKEVAELMAASGATAALPAFPGFMSGASAMARLAWIYSHPVAWGRK